MTSPPPADTTKLAVELVDAIARVPADQWDALGSPDDPFTQHAFLQALEDSESVGPQAGWLPHHVVVRDGDALIGAMPLYVKNNSYGEYIFDWGWADAARRAGLRYYPKLVSAVPFTPATGPRLLSGDTTDPERVEQALMAGALHLAEAAKASSIHVLFCPADQHDRLAGFGLIGRETHQYHWTNEGYDSFDDWLATFRSRRRKETRRERRLPAGIGVLDLPGKELTTAQRRAVRALYEDTCHKRGGYPYLSHEMFDAIFERLDSTRVLLAEERGQVVAMALLFQRGSHLYGRYWGCRPDYESLHFELCYHRPIQLCIDHGWTRFEAGAQGQHKIKRGLVPHPTWSAHWVAHPGLGHAIREACVHEARRTEHAMEMLAEHAPFKREHCG